MTYVPHNQSVFIAAYAGALAGMGANERNPTSPLPASYLEIIVSAGAFAQRFDTVYSGSTMSAQIVAIQHLCHAAWAGRLPIAPTFFVPSAYVELCNALIALVNEFTSYFTTNAIPPTSDVLEMYYSTNWAVTDWYIDGTVGVDTNDGLTAATPIKTGVELQRRLGPYARWDHSVTIHVLANGMTDPLVVKGEILVAGCHLDVIGTPTVLATDVLSSYSGVDHTIPRATEIKGTAIADFTPYVWKRVRITSGPRIGWISWIAKANPAGVAGAARMSQGIAIDSTSTSTVWQTSLVPAAGDQFVIETLPVIPSVSIILNGAIAYTVASSLFAQRSVYVEGISTVTYSVDTQGGHFNNRQLAIGCELASVNIPATSYRDINFTPCGGCLWTSNQSGFTLRPNTLLYYSLVGKNVTAVAFTEQSSVARSTTFQGCSISFSVPGLLSVSQTFDFAGSGAAVSVLNTILLLATVSGTSTTYGLQIYNGSTVILSSPVNIKGTTSDCKFASAPVTNLTQAQCFQPDDYAQKGTATLVAGTVTVTVPWYDNTVQKVTATHNTFGGTPGILSIQKISNSQFTITSSSNLDTSTVDWQISPLGRNIFIT